MQFDSYVLRERSTSPQREEIPEPRKAKRGRPRKPPQAGTPCTDDFNAVAALVASARGLKLGDRALWPAIEQRAREIVDRDQSLPASAPRVLNSLLKHMHWATGLTKVSAKGIARDRGVGEATSKRCLRSLTDGGYALRRLKPGTNTGNRGGPTTYAETTLPVIALAAQQVIAEHGMDGSEKANGRIKENKWTDHKNTNGRIIDDPQTSKSNIIAEPLTQPPPRAARRGWGKEPESLLQEVLADHPEREPIVERLFRPILQRLHPDIPSPVPVLCEIADEFADSGDAVLDHARERILGVRKSTVKPPDIEDALRSALSAEERRQREYEAVEATAGELDEIANAETEADLQRLRVEMVEPSRTRIPNHFWKIKDAFNARLDELRGAAA
jgi:hypothetical protein